MSEAIELPVGHAGAHPQPATRTSLRRSPYAVGGVILLLYALWLGAFSLAGYSAHDLILISKQYATQSHKSSIITYQPHRYRYSHNRVGYDGQFFYFIAVDPLNARYYVDSAPYRYTKILYPTLARLLALGQVQLVPYTLLLINWLAAGAGTTMVAAWLRRRGLSPWLALIYGLYPGIFIGFQRDLTEPLSYALVALGVYLFDFGGRRRILTAAVAFGLAALTRDKSIIFPALYGAAILLHGVRQAVPEARLRLLLRNAWSAIVFGVIALGPLVLWKVCLYLWLRSVTVTAEAGTVTPFGAVGVASTMNAATVVAIPTVVIPGLICAGTAIWALYRRQWDVKVWTLLFVSTFGVVTLDPQFYRDLFAMLRVSAAVMLSALFCIPLIDGLSGRRRWWLWASVAGWIPVPLAFAIFGPVYIMTAT